MMVVMSQTRAIPPYLMRDGVEPSASLREIRESAAVQPTFAAFGEPAYLVTRYADVRAALADHERFSNRRTSTFGRLPADQNGIDAYEPPGALLATDPPQHHRLRRMLTPMFTIRQINRLESRIVEIVDEHLDAMEEAGAPADLVSAFALPVPSRVICELLGVPYADRDDFQRRSLRQLDMALAPLERQAMADESRSYMRSLVERARRAPGDDLIGTLVREQGDEVSDEELAGIGALLLVAGHETTSNMLALGTVALLQHPVQLAAVRDDPAAVGPAVEELLRFASVVQTAIPRITTTDVEVGGVVIPGGSLVLLSLPSANHDPRFVDTPDSFDIHRGAPGHLAFGHGVHHCLGAPLARMEMRIAFPALLLRFPGLKLAGELTEIQFKPTSLVYGAHSLPVVW
jgi:cytochrome P450